jgi:hypothetical protein
MTADTLAAASVAITLLSRRIAPAVPAVVQPACSAAVLTRDTPHRAGRGNCVECHGTGEALGGRSAGLLFCDACGGSGDYHGPPRRIIGPDGAGVTLYGPVPSWLADCISTGITPERPL